MAMDARGLTLLETILSILILAIIGGAGLAMINAVLLATDELELQQTREREVMAFAEMCRQAFANLPADATVWSGEDGPGGIGDGPEGVQIDLAPMLFTFGRAGMHPGSIQIVVEPQVGGLYRLVLHRLPPEDELELDRGMQGESSLVLMRDVADMQWRFYDEQTDQWLEIWEEPGRRPTLVEWTLDAPPLSEPTRAVFRIPVMESPAESAPAPEAEVEEVES